MEFEEEDFEGREGDIGAQGAVGQAVGARFFEGDGLFLLGQVHQAVGGDRGVGVHAGDDGNVGAAGGEGLDPGELAEGVDEVEVGFAVDAGADGEDGALAEFVHDDGGLAGAGAVLVAGEGVGGGGGEGVTEASWGGGGEGFKVRVVGSCGRAH